MENPIKKLILPAVEKVLKTVLHRPASDINKRNSLIITQFKSVLMKWVMNLKASYVIFCQWPISLYSWAGNEALFLAYFPLL